MAWDPTGKLALSEKEEEAKRARRGHRPQALKKKKEEEEEEERRTGRDFWPHRHGDIVIVPV